MEGIRRSITFSPQTDAIVRQLLEYGIYGRTFGEVVRRIVDQKLTEFAVAPKMRRAEIEAEAFENED